MSIPVHNDAELVHKSLAGNRDAFGKIVARYQSLVCSLAFSATGSLSQSEDLAQETFVTAWKQLAGLREPEKLRSWLCRIARNLTYDVLRQQGREPSHRADSLEEIAESHSTEPLPTEQTMSNEEQAILWRSLEKIPEIYREPLVLFYREHQSIEAVAQNLELSEDAVKQRLSRGRKMLHEQVLAFVEGALEKTAPGKNFTLGVVAALPLLVTTTKAAAVGTTLKGGAALKMLFMTKTTQAIIVAAIVLAAVTTPVAVHYYRAATANVSGDIHIRGQLRTSPGDNFSAIMPEAEFVPVEIWKQSKPKLKWRVEEPQRVVVMDGQSTLMYMKPINLANKINQSSTSAFDTDWLQRIANLGLLATNEIRNARARGETVEQTTEVGTDGKTESVVTIESQSKSPDSDYLKNKDFYNADLRQVFHFDVGMKQLKSAQIYLLAGGDEKLIFETTQVDCGKTIDPAVFHYDLPADVSWYQEPQKLPDNQKYASMTAEQAARAFFEACGREDWNEAQKFMSPITPDMRKNLGGMELVSLGKPFKSHDYGGLFVPYEIKLQPQELNVRVSDANPAKRFVLTGVYDGQLKLQQDLKGSSTPEILTNNDVYAKMSAAETVKAYFDAQASLNWVEMRKFTSESDVEQTKSQVAEATKQGLDIHKLMPVFQVGDANWAAKESAWFVKCQMLGIKHFNLALRKDNPAGRWQVDGGL